MVRGAVLCPSSSPKEAQNSNSLFPLCNGVGAGVPRAPSACPSFPFFLGRFIPARLRLFKQLWVGWHVDWRSGL